MFQPLRYLLIRIFGNFFDPGEFLAGIVLGLLAAWFYHRLESTRTAISNWISERAELSISRRDRSSFDRYRVDLVAGAQASHVARVLFALDEIAVTPKLLAPPSPADPEDSDHVPEDTLSIVPNLPDWKFLSGIYSAPTIGLDAALSNGANLLITGRPGSGKSTALAHLAIRLAMRDQAYGKLIDYTPIWIHAADLVLDRNAQKDPLKPVIQAAENSVSPSAASRLSGQLQSHFKRGRAILLLDGLDEFTVPEIEELSAWLGKLVNQYPKVRIVAAGPVKGYNGLVDTGLVPIPIAPWTEQDQRVFLRKWSRAWQEHIAPLLPKNRLGDLDPALLTGWLAGAMRGFTPLEATLHVWSAYIGDARGGRPVDGFEAHISRFLSPNERKSAQASALAWLRGRSGILTDRTIKRGTPIQDMVEAGILTKHIHNRYTFSQPAIGAYLAARAMAEDEFDAQVLQMGWQPSELSMGYFASFGDLSPVIEPRLDRQDDPLSYNLLSMGSWIRHAPKKMPWRAEVLRRLAKIATDPNSPYGLRLRAVHVLSSSEDPTVAIFFRRLLKAENPSSRVLGALGIGGIRDEESVSLLITNINTKRNLHSRQAACLALATIGTDEAMEGLGHILLESDEGVQIAAAEALACNPEEGFSMLRDAIDMKNLLTRRAAVFGLGRIPEEWAFEILETIQLEDDQWVVRGAAAEVLERHRNPPWKVNPRVSDVSEMKWLQDFAEREGLGVAPGKAALEMVRRALNKGSEDEQVAALEAIAWTGGQDLALELMQSLKAKEAHLRDAAFEALWQLDARGVDVGVHIPA
ncbi:MAG: HEAT repeat domain-containing protein [Anaerolineales bacterium]|jgi:HEAT repeat protein